MTYYYHTRSNKDAQLSYPHYSDSNFLGKSAVIFGVAREALKWDYADRLYQWDTEKHKQCMLVMEQLGHTKNTVTGIEVYLSVYHDKQALVECVQAGSSQFDGYPWWAYGYVFAA